MGRSQPRCKRIVKLSATAGQLVQTRGRAREGEREQERGALIRDQTDGGSQRSRACTVTDVIDGLTAANGITQCWLPRLLKASPRHPLSPSIYLTPTPLLLSMSFLSLTHLRFNHLTFSIRYLVHGLLSICLSIHLPYFICLFLD